MRHIWLLLVQALILVQCSRAQDSAGEHCIFAEQKCPNKQISFWLYTNATRDSPAPLNPSNLLAYMFEPHLPLKILIHGFIGNRSLSPNLEVREVLLQTQSVHVISVDYGSLVRFPCYYPWAVQNAPIVGKCLAQLIDGLLDGGIYAREDIHLIGFSLGAQVAGLTANYVRRPLKRITGLDPAGPGFMINNARDKLDKSDADFVDVIHTDPFFFSLPLPMGHADFYPNLQSLNQPGCSYFSGWSFFNCNHYRAAIYYAESITTGSGFWSLNCGGWMEFLMQRCNPYAHIPSTQMGYFVSENASGAYFLSTHNAAPFAKGPIIDFEMDVIDVEHPIKLL